MKVYRTQEEVEKDVVNGVLKIDGDIKIECDVLLSNTSLIIEGDINCRNINCEDIWCWNINCWNINCGDITCRDINCWGINCRGINFYAVAFAYNSFVCKSIKSKRENSKYFCLDSDVKVIEGVE